MRISYHPRSKSIDHKKKTLQKKQSNSKFNSTDTIIELKEYNSTKKNLSAPLLDDNLIYFKENIEKKYYIVEKYDENCIQESRIDKIICLTDDENKIFLFLFISIISLGLIPLIMEIFPLLQLKLRYKICNITNAKYFLIYCTDNEIYICKCYEINCPFLGICNITNYTQLPIHSNKTKMFEFKLHKYAYDSKKKNFNAVNFKLNTTYDIISRKMIHGLNEEEVNYQKIFIYKIKNIKELKKIIPIIIEEISNPFYIIQLICIIFWINYDYSTYSIILFLTSLFTIFFSIYETKLNISEINKISIFNCEIIINRIINGKKIQIFSNSETLVPGDIIEIPDEVDFIMPCDILLVSGSVIMNESFLSGESNPVFKSHIPNSNDKFNIKKAQKYILYSGTKIIQTRSKAFGLVIGIGFDTEKGNLVRAILFKETNSIKSLNKKRMDFIYFLLIFGCFGCIISIFYMMKFNCYFTFIFFKCFHLISIILPESLPICVGIGFTICIFRIKKKGINCLDRSKINISGKIDFVCFDKTGTLTKDHVEAFGFRPINYLKGNFVFGKFIDDISEIVEETYKFYLENYTKLSTQLLLNGKHHERIKQLNLFYIEALACCNSLTRVRGNLIGDPIDLEMFSSSRFSIEENISNNNNLFLSIIKPQIDQINSLNNNIENPNFKYEIGIIRRFEFVSSLQRMSVIVKNINEDFFKIYCKGSPEKIRELCRPETIPSNFNRILTQYSNQGLRVIAISFKMIKTDYQKIQKITRESAEHDMIFLGFFIVANKLRPKTKRTIHILQDAGIKTIVSTGDNVFTASSVAKECYIVPEDQIIYQIDVNPIEKFSGYELTCKELIVDLPDDDEDDSYSDESENDEFNYVRKYSKLTKNMAVESLCEDDLDSENDSYEENDDIHLIIKNQPQIELKSLKIPDIKIKSNSCFAITGTTFKILHKLSLRYLNNPISENKVYHEIFKMILNKTLIFARMLPEHKILLIESIKNLKYTIAMCGDGANDIGALRTADIGISLGLDETSISAHFITSNPDITCILNIICEGKGCLANTVECYKFIILCGIIEFISNVFLLKFNCIFYINQLLLCDLFLIFPNAFLIARSSPIKILTEDKAPEAVLNCLINSFLIESFIMFFFQYISIYLLRRRDWYFKFERNGILNKNSEEPCFENTVLFIICYLQCLIVIIMFSLDTPFKKEIWKNKMLLIYLIVSALFGYYLILVDDSFFIEIFNIKVFDDQKFRFELILLTICNFFISMYAEKELIPKLNKYIKESKNSSINNND